MGWLYITYFSDNHDDVIKWKHFPRNWPFVRGIHRSPVNSPHKGQWRGALMFSLICVWINDWVNNRETGDLGRQCGHYDVIVMTTLPHCLTRAMTIHPHPTTADLTYTKLTPQLFLHKLSHSSQPCAPSSNTHTLTHTHLCWNHSDGWNI